MRWRIASRGCRIRTLPAIDEDPTGIGPVGAEHEPHGLGAAGSGQSGEPQHFAGMAPEADLADQVARAMRSSTRSRSRPRGVSLLGKLGFEGAADHHLDQTRSGQASHLVGAHMLSVAQDHHAVGHREDLVQTMTDVNDAQALFLQLGDDDEQMLDLLGGQGGGGLIHHDNPRVDGQRLGNLHRLLLGHRQLATARCRIDRQAELLKELLSLLLFPGRPNETAASSLASQEDVLTHREVGDEVELLVDDRDPRLLSGAGAAKGDFPSLQHESGRGRDGERRPGS